MRSTLTVVSSTTGGMGLGSNSVTLSSLRPSEFEVGSGLAKMTLRFTISYLVRISLADPKNDWNYKEGFETLKRSRFKTQYYMGTSNNRKKQSRWNVIIINNS